MLLDTDTMELCKAVESGPDYAGVRFAHAACAAAESGKVPGAVVIGGMSQIEDLSDIVLLCPKGSK